jgi:uroporphyrinogen decarboxylase
MTMTSIERVTRALQRRPVDQAPAALSPWDETIRRWVREGHLREGEDVHEHFAQDIHRDGWITGTVDLDFTPQVLEETEETILMLDGNGATLRRHKRHTHTPEHVDFAIKDRAGWEARAKPKLVAPDRRRIAFEGYRTRKRQAAERQRYFCWGGGGPFEQIAPICGHEHMLVGMAEDPAWVREMVMTFSRLTVTHLEILFAEEGLPDGFFFSEDMGFKHHPFMSPAMYREIVWPGHKLLFDYAHSLGCKVIMHSCGYVEPLVPGMIEAGLDCLQAMEVKAGMDLPKLFDRFGDRLAFYGGLDVRALIDNDRARINAELDKMRYVLDRGGGYILHTDHSEPPEIDYATMRYFIDQGRRISRQTARPGVTS